MSWWAALLGFVGALAGSWGGQLIATLREDRRWEREREREDLRWQRDREKGERSEKLTAIARYAGLIRLWQETLWDAHNRAEKPPLTAEMEAELRTIARDAAMALAEVELVAGRQLQKIARDTYYEHASTISELRSKTYQQRGGAEFTRLTNRDEDLRWLMRLAKQELDGDEHAGHED